MRATIAKDDEFKTIGLVVIDDDFGGMVVYQWGIEPDRRFNYTKDVKMNLDTFTRLQRIGQRLADLDDFKSRFFDVAIDNNLLKKDSDGNYLGVKFASIDKKMESLTSERDNIISKLS